MSLPPHLLDVLKELQKKCRSLKSRNPSEADTKRILIEPLLEALNWDTRNYDEVRNEYRSASNDNPADYGLLFNNQPKLLIEAKSIKTNILKDRKAASQIVAYSATAGVNFCVLTNGDDWLIFNAHAPIEIDKKQFRHLSISDGNWDGFQMLEKNSLFGPMLQDIWDIEFTGAIVHRKICEIFQNGGTLSLVKEILKENLLRGKRKSEISSIIKRLEVFLPGLYNPPNPIISEKKSTRTPNLKKSPIIGLYLSGCKSQLVDASNCSAYLYFRSKKYNRGDFHYWFTATRPRIEFLKNFERKSIILELDGLGIIAFEITVDFNLDAKRWDIKVKHQQGKSFYLKVNASPFSDFSNFYYPDIRSFEKTL